jgi:hypothetical protein
MKNILKIALFTTIGFSAISFNALAEENKPAIQKQASDQADYEQIKADFRKYMATVNPEIKKEIKNFRSEMKKLNELKFELYKNLTQEAQQFLKTENEFKKKLPWKQRREFLKDVNEDSAAEGKKQDTDAKNNVPATQASVTTPVAAKPAAAK